MPGNGSPEPLETWFTMLMKDHRLEGWCLSPEIRGVVSERPDRVALWARKPSISVEIQKIRDFGWGENIDRRDFRIIEFAELWDGVEIGVYSLRFTKVRNPDLRDINHLQSVLAARFENESPSAWVAKHQELRREADAVFAAKIKDIDDQGPTGSKSKEEWESRRQEYSQWFARQGELMVKAHSEAYEKLNIVGSANDQVIGTAIEVIAGDAYEREMLARVDDDLRCRIEDIIRRKSDSAYRLGRWIREAEIVEDHGPMVEYAQETQKARELGGSVTGRASAAMTDDAWRDHGKKVWQRLENDNPTWGATRIAKKIQDEVPLAANLDTNTVKSTVEKWRRGKSKST